MNELPYEAPYEVVDMVNEPNDHQGEQSIANRSDTSRPTNTISLPTLSPSARASKPDAAPRSPPEEVATIENNGSDSNHIANDSSAPVQYANVASSEYADLDTRPPQPPNVYSRLE